LHRRWRRPLSGPVASERPQSGWARRSGGGSPGLVNALDPDAVILGGLAPRLLAVAPGAINAAYAKGLMGTRSRVPVALTAGSLGEEAPMIGAGEQAFARILSDLQARA
jgi:predicted NBD/HSP70 family sugar kinase